MIYETNLKIRSSHDLNTLNPRIQQRSPTDPLFLTRSEANSWSRKSSIHNTSSVSPFQKSALNCSPNVKNGFHQNHIIQWSDSSKETSLHQQITWLFVLNSAWKRSTKLFEAHGGFIQIWKIRSTNCRLRMWPNWNFCGELPTRKAPL